MLPDRRSLRIGSETTHVEAVPDVGGRTGLRRLSNAIGMRFATPPVPALRGRGPWPSQSRQRCFVDENQPGGIKRGLARLPALAPESNVRSILFGRAKAFFECHAFMPEKMPKRIVALLAHDQFRDVASTRTKTKPGDVKIPWRRCTAARSFASTELMRDPCEPHRARHLKPDGRVALMFGRCFMFQMFHSALMCVQRLGS